MIQLFLTKMFASSAILFGYYYMFLRNKRFHHYNRFYLLSICLLSVTIPCIRIPIFLEPNTATAEIVSRSISIISVNSWEEEAIVNAAASANSSWYSLQTLFFTMYFIVALFLLHWLVRSLKYIRTLADKYPCQQIDSLKFFNTTESGTPFSFFRSIFWNSAVDVNSDDGQKIFKHELFHVKQKHSLDILLMEILCAFFWINPIFHLIKRELKAIHEFLADQYAIQDEDRHDYAELLILQSLKSKQSPIANYFFQNHIKRRIAMITQLKNKKYSYSSRLLVLPLGILIFCSIALYAQNGLSAAEKKQSNTLQIERAAESITVVVDAGHGGDDHGVSNEGGLDEKDLALAIAKQIKDQAPAHNIKVVMTRDADATTALKQRSDAVDLAKANLFISIHVASAPNDTRSSGFDIFITNRNQQTLPDSRRLGVHIAKSVGQLYAVNPIKQRQEQGIWVLDKVNCPAVLIECGYMSSATDLAFISEPSNQQKIAKTILQGIVDYLTKPVTQHLTDTIPASIVLNDTVKLTEAQKKRQIEQSKELERRRAEVAKKYKELVKKQQELAAAQQQVYRSKIGAQKLQQQQLHQKQTELAKMQNKVAEQRSMEMKLREKELSHKRKEMELVQQKYAQEGHDLVEKRREVERLNQQVNEERLSKLRSEQQAMLEKQEKLSRMREEMTEQKRAQIHSEHRERLQKMEEAKTRKVERENDEIQERQKAIESKQREAQDQSQKAVESNKRKTDQ